MDAENGIELMVERTINAITHIVRRITRYTTILLLAVSVVVVGSFLLGLAAMNDGIRAVWIVLGTVFATTAIGAVLLARWRIGRVRRHVPAIASEVRQMIADGKGQTQLIIQEFQDGDDQPVSESAIVVSRRLYGMRGAAGHGMEGSARLTDAVTAITTFPGLALASIAITLVFGFLAVIFLLALAL